MKQLNFDELKNLRAPESWVENALEIPNKRRALFLRRTRITAVAASLAIISTVGFSVILQTQKGVVSKPSASTVAVTQSATPISSVSETFPSSEKSSVISENDLVFFTEKNETVTKKNDVEPTREVTEPDKIDPHSETEATEPTEKSSTSGGTEPVRSATQAPVTQHTLTNPVTSEPTRALETSSPPPTAPEAESTTSGNYVAEENGICRAIIPAEKLSGKVYCTIFNSKGGTVVENASAYTYTSGKWAVLEYIPPYGVAFASSTYTAVFTDEDGNELIKTTFKPKG